MKKDLLALAFVILLIVVLVRGTKIQTVDEYYTTHIDDITENSKTVMMSIRCDTVLDNIDMLTPELNNEKYVPPDGVILSPTKYVLRDNDTVFDILNRVARANKIQIDYQDEALNKFGSVYVKSINYIYEFSCGELSGWMYRVNGEFPDSGCSRYTLNDGDIIEWVYTCDLGRDIGCVWTGGTEER